ncbi:hypothetical protein GCM10009839_24080 [Catenulispora yoronensis]|uniref:Uncharacterized protein n=1 Tax=Catenulispora yoronensis TaxID=450799 RepID=A0ABN2TZH3_9ACTN
MPGVTIAGARGVVLRTNYRNAEEIWNTAMAVVAGDSFEDLDETRALGRRDVETTYRDACKIGTFSIASRVWNSSMPSCPVMTRSARHRWI